MRTEIIYVDACIHCDFINDTGTKCKKKKGIRLSASFLNAVHPKCPLREKEFQITLKLGV
jgi:hypothetical protein